MTTVLQVLQGSFPHPQRIPGEHPVERFQSTFWNWTHAYAYKRLAVFVFLKHLKEKASHYLFTSLRVRTERPIIYGLYKQHSKKQFHCLLQHPTKLSLTGWFKYNRRPIPLFEGRERNKIFCQGLVQSVAFLPSSIFIQPKGRFRISQETKWWNKLVT